MAELAYDPTTSLGRVRMLIGDTSDSTRFTSDAEITAFLSLGGSNVFTAASLACKAIAACAAKSAIAYSIMQAQFRVDKRKVPDYFMALAKEYANDASMNDTTDYTVDWGRLISKVDGRDESDYADDDNENYYQDHYWDGDA